MEDKYTYIHTREELKDWLDYERDFYSTHNRRIWRFIKALRKTEYYYNRKSDGHRMARLGYCVNRARLIFWQTLFGFEIGVNVCGKGLKIAHIGSVIINNTSHVGKDCYIIGNVCLGSKGGSEGPVIGDNVELGFGACVIGNVHIGNNVYIGANAVVNKDFLEDNIRIAGVPARRI
ncbi:MAG: serine acetyltransferase [Lachnospiraceae bacterium]|nr:serine acetyltransferase [Lachnospiraceae bacterium]